MVSVIKHLSDQVPIVRSDGTPTPYFARLLEEISDAKIAASVIDAMGGDPGADMVVVWDDATNDLIFLSLSDLLDWIDNTHGAILYRDSASWAALAPGTDGDVLTTHGASADPTWETPSSSGSFRGALVNKGSNQTGANYTTATPITFDTESYDTDSIHNFSSTVTITIASPGVVTWTGHNFVAGAPIVFSTTGALPTGLTAGTTYYVVSPAANTFQVSATIGGSAINTTGSQSGVHTATNLSRLVVPSGVTKVRLQGGVRMTAKTADTFTHLVIEKTGGTVSYAGQGRTSTEVGTTSHDINVTSAIVTVSAGDYFELFLQVETDTSIDLSATLTWFAMEILA